MAEQSGQLLDYLAQHSRELDQLSLQLGHLVIGGILACMDRRKANKDWPVWFDPWVCLVSSGVSVPTTPSMR